MCRDTSGLTGAKFLPGKFVPEKSPKLCARILGTAIVGNRREIVGLAVLFGGALSAL
jgi:hypothetical protein